MLDEPELFIIQWSSFIIFLGANPKCNAKIVINICLLGEGEKGSLFFGNGARAGRSGSAATAHEISHG